MDEVVPVARLAGLLSLSEEEGARAALALAELLEGRGSEALEGLPEGARKALYELAEFILYLGGDAAWWSRRLREACAAWERTREGGGPP